MRIIDLTFSIEEDIPCFGAKWHVAPSFKQLGQVSEVGRNTTQICMGSHTGTHVDAARHFFNEGSSIDELELNDLCGDVTVVDLRGRCENGAVTKGILEQLTITKRMLFVFGWSSHWRAGDYYQGYPYFTLDAAQYLVDSGVKLVAMDTPSPDDSRTKLLSMEDSIIHKLFLGNNVILVEYLANTNLINFCSKYQIYALPIKLKGCDGSPARVILVELTEGNKQ